MSTKHTSFIPMTPDARPKQRLNEVVSLPDKPDDLNILIEWKDSIPFKHYPKGSPWLRPKFSMSSCRGKPALARLLEFVTLEFNLT